LLSLLGDCYGERRSGEGTRLKFRKVSNLLHENFSEGEYCNKNLSALSKRK